MSPRFEHFADPIGPLTRDTCHLCIDDSEGGGVIQGGGGGG